GRLHGAVVAAEEPGDDRLRVERARRRLRAREDERRDAEGVAPEVALALLLVDHVVGEVALEARREPAAPALVAREHERRVARVGREAQLAFERRPVVEPERGARDAGPQALRATKKPVPGTRSSPASPAAVTSARSDSSSGKTCRKSGSPPGPGTNRSPGSRPASASRSARSARRGRAKGDARGRSPRASAI